MYKNDKILKEYFSTVSMTSSVEYAFFLILTVSFDSLGYFLCTCMLLHFGMGALKAKADVPGRSFIVNVLWYNSLYVISGGKDLLEYY